MRKLILVLALLAFIVGGASAQANFEDFMSAFEGFAGSMASTLAVNSTIGMSWSDAYVGRFPHLGVGLVLGAALTGANTADKLFESLGETVPSGIADNGFPIPAAAFSAKIGLPFIPADLGIKFGTITPSMADSIKESTEVAAEYTNFGLQLRYALTKETFLIPDISVGLGFSWQKGSLRTPVEGFGSGNVSYTDGTSTWIVGFTDPDLMLAWQSTNIDLSLQASKTLLFILTPYIGAGVTLGKATVDGGLESNITASASGAVGTLSGQAAIDSLSSFYEAIVGEALDLNLNDGFTFTTDYDKPVVRLYGGFSLNILVVFDFQMTYVPKTKAYGGSLMARIQL